jgi:hypothetical protein
LLGILSKVSSITRGILGSEILGVEAPVARQAMPNYARGEEDLDPGVIIPRHELQIPQPDPSYGVLQEKKRTFISIHNMPTQVGTRNSKRAKKKRKKDDEFGDLFSSLS